MSRNLLEEDVAVTILAVGIIVAFFSPWLTNLVAPYTLPALFFVILFGLIPFADVSRTELTNIDLPVWRMVIWQQFVLPCLVIALGVLAEFPDYVVSLMIVTACAGSLFASPALAQLLNLDRNRALQCMVLSTLIMPASLYVFLTAFHSVNIHLDLHDYLRRTAIFLIIPFVFFMLYRPLSARLSPGASNVANRFSRWGAVFALLIFGIGIMQAAANQFINEPQKILFYLAIVSTLSVGMLIVTVIVMFRFGATEALTAGVLNGFRNVGLGFALVGDMIGSELAPYVGVSMIPVFVAPAVIRLTASSGEQAYTLSPGDEALEAADAASAQAPAPAAA
ncbi:MAG: hypothetical protein AAFQ45_07990 [Pseudomonadota bacterium]